MYSITGCVEEKPARGKECVSYLDQIKKVTKSLLWQSSAVHVIIHGGEQNHRRMHGT